MLSLSRPRKMKPGGAVRYLKYICTLYSGLPLMKQNNICVILENGEKCSDT